MNDDRIAAERADIERRVAKFRATQAQFQREREAYCETTLEQIRALRGNENRGNVLSA